MEGVEVNDKGRSKAAGDICKKEAGSETQRPAAESGTSVCEGGWGPTDPHALCPQGFPAPPPATDRSRIHALGAAGGAPGGGVGFHKGGGRWSGVDPRAKTVKRDDYALEIALGDE